MIVATRETDETACNPIAWDEKKEIGGLKQWLLYRGNSIHNPVLLYLHGGPGSAEWPLMRVYNRELEKYFMIVYWDQRGAGKSYYQKTPDMNIHQFVCDTYEIVEYLRRKFGREKIFIMGHSWGSLLGTLVVQKHPELFYAYIGIGQFVSGKENETKSFQYTLDMAHKTNNQKAIRQLTGINYLKFLGAFGENKLWFQELRLQRDWLLKLGGSIYAKKNQHFVKWIFPYFNTPEYSILDFIKYVRGFIASIKMVWPELMEIDFFEQVPKLDVPCYFLIGKHDYTTPFELAEQYYHQLIAPQKELIWFENSAHHPMYEEAAKFNEILIQKVRLEVHS